MAITKIHAIKATVNKAVDYICNPAKTDESILISSFGCSPETAAFDFKFALSKTNQADLNKAFHLIQAFMPGEVSYKEAHQIGIELADKLLEGKYSYIVATHIDKGHVHNHIIFCAADNINHEKYHDCKKTYYHIRHLNDELCSEHQLSVLPPTDQRGKTYKEWLSSKKNFSWKTRLKNDIDEAIQTADTYEDFLDLIRAKGYEIKGETLDEKSLKYISFRPLDREHFIRGRANSLGAEYTKERIKERIKAKALIQPKKRIPFPKRKKQLVKDYSSQKLIDTSEEKFEHSPGLKAWADIQNLKIAASSYSETGSIAELKKQLAAKSVLAKTARSSLVEIEHQLKDLGQILKYAEQYQKNKIYDDHYKSSKDPDRYFRKYESQIILFAGAEHILQENGMDLKHLNTNKLQEQLSDLISQKKSLNTQYVSFKQEIKELELIHQNLSKYLKQDAPEIQRSSHNQLPSL